MAFGDRVKEIRKVLKITQNDFSVLANIDRGRLGRVEKNKEKLTIDQMNKLSQKENVNLTWLITGKGSMFLREDTKSDHHKGRGLEENYLYHEMSKAEIELLKEIIRLSEEACMELNIKVDPKIKAEQIVKLYLHYHKEEIAVDKNTIKTVLKLVL